MVLVEGREAFESAPRPWIAVDVVGPQTFVVEEADFFEDSSGGSSEGSSGGCPKDSYPGGGEAKSEDCRRCTKK